MRRALLSVFFIVYFVVWLAGGVNWRPTRFLPEWLIFFTRSACLFPHAAEDAVDYYAEGWSCAQRHWVELDYHPYFPIIISGRETRFDRIVHLHRYNQRVLSELRAFLVRRWNADHAGDPITDVRLLSVRTPVPAPGVPIERYARRPLNTIPGPLQKLWSRYVPLPVRDARCADVKNGLPLNLEEGERRGPRREPKRASFPSDGPPAAPVSPVPPGPPGSAETQGHGGEEAQ